MLLSTRLQAARIHLRIACLAIAMFLPGISLALPPIRIVVPYAAGGTLDAMARLLARHMYAGTDQTVIIENRPGGDNTVGTRQVVRAAPDGRTLLIVSTAFAVVAAMQPLDYDVQRDLAPVIKVATGEMFLAAHGGLDVQSVGDLKRVAQLRPGGLNCAGLPGQTALACDRLARLLDVPMVTIPFHSLAPAINALAAGHVDVIFTPRGAVQSLASPQIRVLAAATAGPPAPPYQNLPLLKDRWPNMVMTTSAGIYVPSGTSASVVASLNRELNRVVALPEVRSTLVELGYTIVGGGPEVLARNLSEELTFYRQLVLDTKSKMDAGNQ